MEQLRYYWYGVCCLPLNSLAAGQTQRLDQRFTKDRFDGMIRTIQIIVRRIACGLYLPNYFLKNRL